MQEEYFDSSDSDKTFKESDCFNKKEAAKLTLINGLMTELFAKQPVTVFLNRADQKTPSETNYNYYELF